MKSKWRVNGRSERKTNGDKKEKDAMKIDTASKSNSGSSRFQNSKTFVSFSESVSN